MADIINLEPVIVGYNGDPFNTAVFATPTASMKAFESIVNATWNLGLETKSEYSTKVGTVTAGLGASNITAGVVVAPTIVEPAVDIPATQSAGDVIALFDGKYAELVTMLSDKFTTFRNTYFPDESGAYVAAENWLQDAMANPQSGLPATVQAQIFGDDQARIIGEATRAADSTIAQFAARGFPLPPDAAASAVLQIQQKAQDELAESSRKIAMLSVEMQKFSIEKLLDLRKTAMDSAIRYIMAIASAPEMASKLVGIGYDAQSKLISSAAAFYGARTNAAELVSKVRQFNESLALEAQAKNQAAELSSDEIRVKALLSDAASIAQMATSMFNNLHVGANISMSGTTTANSTMAA